MSLYTINIIIRDYSQILLEHENSENNISIENEFIKNFYGYFDGDKIIYNKETNRIEKLLERKISDILGMIDYFGKYQFPNNKRNLPGYMFIPCNKKIPKFIVYSSEKKKFKKNQLANIEYKSWDMDIPIGTIKQILGDFDSILAMEKFLIIDLDLKPKRIVIKPPFKEDFNNRVKIENKIFTIDPINCLDVDDGFSLIRKDTSFKIQVHISDVFHFLNINEIINDISNVSSIYLTKNILNMLPDILSYNYCSLLEKTTKPLITLELFLDRDHDKCNYKFYKSYGNITKNYSYDNYPKKIDSYFDIIEEICLRLLGKQYKIKNSHDFIEILMIIYNYLFVDNLEKLKSNKIIYRIQKKNYNLGTELLDENLRKFMNVINSESSIYSYFKESHDMLVVAKYTHATSPIRRIIDLINQALYYNSLEKLNNTIQNLDYVNTFNKKLKKFYRKRNKLYLAKKLHSDTYKEYSGYIYDHSDDKIYIYLDEEGMNFSYKFYTKSPIYMVNYVLYVDLEFNENFIEIPYKKKIKMKLTGNPDIFNINESIKIIF